MNQTWTGNLGRASRCCSTRFFKHYAAIIQSVYEAAAANFAAKIVMLSVHAACSSALAGDNSLADDFGNLRDDCVSEGLGSLHAAGNPIIASNSEGCG